ncbi:MAG TPA: hypothetical protein VLL52_13470 [Anaerolineae bacterium]|nr:hypothetical protein [Anaerolineae bacterium]
MVLDKLEEWWHYLWNKRSEVQELRWQDILMTKAILDIHRKRVHKEFVMVPLYQIKPLHPLDRENTIAAVERRAEILREGRERILAGGLLTRELLDEYIPSITAIKVVADSEGGYISYEGNGRLGAMRQVFTPEDGIKVEVEEYYFRNPKKIVRRLNRVRRANGILKEA